MTTHSKHKRAFVLMSGGVDSTTCLYKALAHMDGDASRVVAYSMDYGQLHAKETEQAKLICANVGVEHKTLDIKGYAKGALTESADAIPDCSYEDIQGMSPTYMPFRNGFMLSRLAAEAQEYVLGVQQQLETESQNHCGNNSAAPQSAMEDMVWLYFGAHAEDSENWAYPDCTPEFIGAMSNAIYIGTYRSVRVLAPYAYSSKTTIIREGTELGVPYADTWSCYKGLEHHCGTCPTCIARKEAFREAGVKDPTKYLV